VKGPVGAASKPQHVVRAPDADGRRACSRRRVDLAPDEAYWPGYFTALVRQHNWPPQFQPHCLGDGGRKKLGRPGLVLTNAAS